MKSSFSCLADMEDDNLLLNIISEPLPTKSKFIGKTPVVCSFFKEKILFLFIYYRNENLML